MLQEVAGKCLPFASGEMVDGCVSVSNCAAVIMLLWLQSSVGV